MPKALAKSKHGRNAQGSSQPTPSGPEPSWLDVPQDMLTCGKDSHSHHKPRKHISTSKDERRRDKVLKKIYEKASGHLSSSTAPKEAVGPSNGLELPVEWSSAVTPDQMSL